jgi:hypothetical protein
MTVAVDSTPASTEFIGRWPGNTAPPWTFLRANHLNRSARRSPELHN